MKLTSYETHVLIKKAIPEAKTVFEQEQDDKQYKFPWYNEMIKQ